MEPPLYAIPGWAFQVDAGSVGHTPYGTTPLKRLVSEHEPSALRAPFPRRRSARPG